MPNRVRRTRVSNILKSSSTLLTVLLFVLVTAASSRAQTSGSTKWIATFNGAGNGAETQPLAIATDSEGNAYVTGWDMVSPNECLAPENCTQAVTIKYDPTGKVVWKDWLSSTGIGTARGMNIAVDSNGNAYVLFNFTHPLAGNSSQTVPEVVTAKYNSAGGRDWINFIDSSESGAVQRTPVGLAVSPLGDVYVVYAKDSSSTATAVTVKYDTAGHFLWSETINDATGSDAGTRPFAIGLDASESVYVDVGLSSTTDVSDGEIVKYDVNGVRLASFGRGQISGGNGFHVDAGGACYFSGDAAQATTGEPDSIVAKFNADQSLAYIVDITKLEGIGGSELPPSGLIGAIASDSAGDAFLLQRFDFTGPHQDGNVISVLKLDPSGNEVFVTRYNQETDESGYGYSEGLAVSSSGDFYVTGTSSPEQPSSAYDFVTLKYDNSGALQWVEQYPGTDEPAHANGIALFGDNLVVTGTTPETTESAWATISYVS